MKKEYQISEFFTGVEIGFLELRENGSLEDVLYFLCCIFCVVLYKLNSRHTDFVLYCTLLDFFNFPFRVVLYLP